MTTENPYIFLKNNLFLQFLIADRYRIYRHIAGCSSLLLFFTLSRQWGDYEGIIDLWDWIEKWLGITATFYLNMYVLIPRFFFKGKLATYIILLTLWVFFMLGSTYYLNFVLWKDYMIGKEIKMASKTPISVILLSTLVYVVPFVMTSTLIKIFQVWVKDSERMQELERQAAESELQALRSQIQPHFLFNMLNSINVLVHINPEKASYTITKLSDFLRHLLYQSHEERVFLSSELRFLADYLSLEAMRRDDFTYELTYDEKNVQGIQIPPNILLILAENAVKHSIDALAPTYIYIKCEQKEGWLHFSVRNSVPLQPNPQQKFSGIGLTNLRRRLELLYGNRFKLSQEALPQEYLVTLALQL
ncbi:histidine kinase [Capnocytophaga genosp. AHN8471]|uniref:sensor histidine kinase n=1 Tax=Capnocytophaga genosp. AHN8471 TaxID=327574 RepID=UPI00193484CD|nr:histidine kinase [Capnocytophaga genosp. AHN8471]MBM0652181.1 histidine kinase [Capnocytophaga genosp. AHN8471]